MTVLKWAQSAKADLVTLQNEKGIPALWSAAQMCHESASQGGAALSDLATEACNFGGLKFAGWQERFGCSPVVYGTWEVLDGKRVDLRDAFCGCPDWSTWLQVYAYLLTNWGYASALKYAHDPFLYGYHVWKAGYATDPAYLLGVAGWMDRLWDDYADTIPLGPYKKVPIKAEGGRLLATGFKGPDQRTYIPLRIIGEAMGQNVGWDTATESATVGYPGQKA